MQSFTTGEARRGEAKIFFDRANKLCENAMCIAYVCCIGLPINHIWWSDVIGQKYRATVAVYTKRC